MCGGICWFSVGSCREGKRKVFLSSSIVVFFVLIVFMAINLFFALFGAALIMLLAVYVSNKNRGKYGKQILHGAVGSLWLSIPIYLYLVANA